jgi:hypothetical protein
MTFQIVLSYLQNLRFFVDTTIGLKTIFQTMMIAFLVQLLNFVNNTLLLCLLFLQFNLYLVAIRSIKITFNFKRRLQFEGVTLIQSGLASHEIFKFLNKKIEEYLERIMGMPVDGLRRVSNDRIDRSSNSGLAEKVIWVNTDKSENVKSFFEFSMKSGNVFIKYNGPLDLEVHSYLNILSSKLEQKLNSLIEGSPGYLKIASENEMPAYSKTVETRKTTRDNKEPPIHIIKEPSTHEQIDKIETDETPKQASKVLESSNFKKNKELIDIVEPELLLSKAPSPVDDLESTDYIDLMADKKISEYYDYTSELSKFQLEEEKPLYKIYGRQDPHFITKMAKLSINVSQTTLFEALADPSVMKTVNSLLDSAGIVKRYSPTHCLTSFVIKAPFPMSNRDFANYTVYRKVSDKRAILISINCSEKLFPLNKKYVRGRIIRRYGLRDLGCHRDRSTKTGRHNGFKSQPENRVCLKVE